jgi:hypothetical protein
MTPLISASDLDHRTASPAVPFRFQPGAVRYIKLGRGGGWADAALADGLVPFGYREIDHDLCVAGDWAGVRKQLLAMGRTPSGASHGVRELRDFYELPDDTLWITLANGHLWWTFAEADVVRHARVSDADGPVRSRRCREGWSRHDLAGEPLDVRSLSSALLRTANYRMTICAVECIDYLLRRIRGDRAPLHTEAQLSLQALQSTTLALIRLLDWADFEALADLLFASGGWQRVSVLGGGQPDVDMILTQPITGETAWVQVKSSASQTVFKDYLARFGKDGSCDRLFFVCHSGELTSPDPSRVLVWCGERLARATLEAGLLGWVMARTG